MYGLGLSVAGIAARALTPIQQAIAVLRKYPAGDAHAFVPGIGWLNGLQAANYLNSAGTTQGTVDQPVGLDLDAMGVLGPELVTNGGPFTVTTGWRTTGASGISVVANNLRVTSTGTAWPLAQYDMATVVGKTYTVTGTLSGSSGVTNLGVGVSGMLDVVKTSPTGYTYTFVAVNTASSAYVGLNGASTNGDYVDLGKLSVREITGIHATQPTTAAKPILRRGVVNLLTYSQDFTNVAWGKQEVSITPNTHTGYDGALTASTLTVTSVTDPFLAQSVSTTSGFTQIVLVKQGGANPSPRAYLRPITFATAVQDDQCYFDFATKTFNVIGTLSNYDYLELGSGWFAIFAVNATAAGQTGTEMRVCPWGAVGAVTGQTMLIQRAGLFTGQLTASQIQALGGIPLTTTAPASTALGPYFWQFDGVDDSLALSGPLFQMSDDFAIIAGVNSAITTGTPGIFSVDDVGVTPTNGVILYLATGIPSLFLNAGSSQQIATTPALAANTPAVISARKVSTTAKIRKNAVDGASVSTAGVGSATFTGSRIGFQYAGFTYWQGSIYPIIAIKGTVTDADLLTLERFVGSLSGVTI